MDDRAKVRALWREGYSVWFPDGPESPNIALIEIDVETAKSWSEPASFLTYAYHYVMAKLTGRSPSPEQIAEEVLVHF